MTDMKTLSKLPRDDAYWAALEARIVAAAVGELSDATSRERGGPQLRLERKPWHAPLTNGAWRLGAAAVAAALLFFFLPPRAQRAEAAPAGVLAAPSSDVPGLADLVTGEGPPSLAALLVPATRGTP